MSKIISSFQLLLILLIVGCGHEIKNPLHLKINDFTFINQDFERVSLADLQGQVWVANFVFTNCTTVCIPMMTNMVKLQDKLKDEKLNVGFISFSVDPVADTPEVLKDYATSFNADLSNWNFLTDYSQEEIEHFAMESFKTYAKKPEIDNQVIHGTSFFLVDKEGVVVKEYSGLDAPIDDIIKDLKYLISKE